MTKPGEGMFMTSEEREQKIREIAYRYYEIRCHYGVRGTPESDWLKAEEIFDNDYPHKITIDDKLRENGY